ncbi:autotransporter domain-containing protein [Phascolarctobacterium succinatutens]|uniref:autotransporter domain-containing protein n=1 Tax=Phascolarctobacterium succinatutens TaxID=626940 RepID=UPI0030792578
MNTADSYFKGTIFNDNGTGDAYMLLANGAQWTNESKGDYGYHGSSLKQLAGGEADAKAGNIFQKDSSSLTIDSYSGNTNIFYAHSGNGEAAENYAAGNTVIKGAAKDSVVSMVTDNTGVAMDNKDSVANVLNALAGKLTYSNYVNGENNLTGYVKIADGLTASSAALKSGDISFNKEDGKGSYSAQAPVVPEAKTEFTTTLTGDKATDTEYADANIIADDGTYKFAKDSTITTTDKHGADIKQAATINAEGKTLTFNTNVTGSSAVYALGASSADGVTVNADKLVINASSTSGRVEGINVGQGAQSKDNPMKLTINGDTEMNMKGIGYTLGLYANGNAEVTFNGNVTAMGNENSEWGLTSKDGAYGYYGCSLVYSGSNYSLQMGPKVTINGDVNAKIDGNCLFANGGHAKLTINGGGNIEINKDNEHNYYAMMAESGTTSMNVNLDENYDAVSARDNKLVLKGNVGASTGAINANEPELYTKVNLGLATADSVWTGVAHNGFKDEGNKSGSKTFYGAINVFLQNGATWNNEEWGETSTPWGGTGFEGSHVAKFVGGVSDAKAGNIFQNDSNNLTIDNYSGNTNIFYAHTGNGEAAENYAAGDTVIRGAAEGSAVSLITDNTGVAMDNKESVANVLNALAGKLTYSNYVNGENNLTGYVKIADGLTASSAALKTGDITFSKEDGKGSYPTETPVVPPKTEFTTALTGDAATDTEYVGNIQDGKYVFGANTTINAAAKNAVEVKAPLTIDAGNNQLVLMAKQGDYISAVPLFKQAVEGTTSIKADKLVIKNCTNDFKERSGMEVTKGNVDINADVDMKLSAASNAYGIYVKANGSSVAIHGDLNLADSEQYDSINGLYVENAVDFGAKTSAITVDGKADINLRNGNAITAIRNGSTVSVGGGNIKIAKNNSKEFYALQSDGGVVNVNMNADKNAAGTATTVIEGNISAFGEKTKAASDMDVTNSIINIGLSDKDSSWTGTAFAKDLGTSGFPFKGIINLYLANGATWNNEAWGKTNAAFEGSHVAKLAGGASEAAAGNIFQKDSNNLTIDNYSGNTNIFYAHTGNGENASNYAAGDTIIKSAAAGSAVSLITDSTGIAMENDASVANVLNALAGKLTYSNFVNGENNLNGSVKIAAGLTASDKIMKVDTIKFNKDTGKGYTTEETVNPGGGEKTTFTDAITGEKQGVFSAVQQEDLSYVFAEDASININQMTHKEKDPDWEGSFIISGAAVQNAAGVENLVINAADKTLKLNVALDSKTVPPDKNAGILNNRIPLRGIDNSIAGSTTSITAGTLDINIDNTYSRKTSSGNPLIGEGSAIGIYAKSAGEKAVVEVTGNTAIKAHGYNNVYGVNANGNAEIKLHGDLTMAKDGEEWALDNVIKGQNTTTLGESSWRNIAGINANGAGASVTVDGKTTIAAHGSGVVAADGAIVNLGAADIEIKNNSSEDGYGFHALGAALGTVNVGGEGKTVIVKGNAGLFGKQGQKFASDSKESVINLKLTTEDSAWTGVAYKHFDAEKDAGLSGSMNLTLANGASWNNEKYGYVYGDSEWEKYKFTGSEIADFVGGASEAKAGNIFQKDANSLTIDNYSGNTNIFYAHTGNGEAADNYAAGDTVIKHAAAGSVVSMITDNTGIAMDNQASVNNVLNALAGKLTYSNFVNGEKNLTGFVKIADGLTASSAALKTGDITFNTEDGKGSLNKEDIKPEPPTPPTPTYPEDQKADKFDQGITGNDEKYKEEGVLKEDGSYVFTKNPTSIEVEKGAAVEATDKDINIDTTKAKLELKGAIGINAEGANVTVNGNTSISGATGINAANGNVTLNGSTVISGTDAAINAGENANVNVNGNNSALTVNGSINADGGNITVDSGKATGTITGDINAANGGSVVINLTEKGSTLTGGYNVDGDSSIALGLANGATWKLTDGEEAAGMSLLRMAKGAAAAGLTINGGATKEATGYLDMTKRTKDLDIAHYSGWETIIYGHENAGADVADYKSGDTIIDKAAKGSGVILSTDNSGIDMKDKNAVEATLKALAQKVTYNDHKANGENLSGKVQIAEGLTSSSVGKNLGTIHWDENGKGQYDLDSVNWSQIIEGDYETFVMKGVRSAATTSLHTWRDNMQDTYTGADLADEDGMFAKALGGKTSSDVKGLKDSNTYYGVQVGYDKAAANGWHTGVAFDYRNGDSNYLLGGKGDNQMYSLGVYGVKSFENDAFFRVAAKVGRVENEYDVYNEIRSLKLHGDYKANAYGLTMEYGKTFGDEEAYFTPKAQLTWSQVGAKDYTAHTDNATMQISQDSYSSFVGRLGFEAGVKSEKGRVYAGLFAAHEFNGDISASYFANDGDRKHTSFDGEENWMEMKLGGTYDFSNNAHLYADIAKDFNGNFERKWKMNVGLRFEF